MNDRPDYQDIKDPNDTHMSFVSGLRAYCQGKEQEDNPHDERSYPNQYDQWSAGWDAAKARHYFSESEG